MATDTRNDDLVNFGQALLLQRRAEYKRNTGERDAASRPVTGPSANGVGELRANIDLTTANCGLWPAHAVEAVAAGRQWGSPGETIAIRQWLARQEKRGGEAVDYRALADEAWELFSQKACVAGDIGPVQGQSVSADDGVRHYPTLGLAARRAGESKLYRDWLVARFLDVNGSGWCDEAELRQALTDESSPLRCFSPRQWRTHRSEGEGRYWTLEAARDGSTRLRYTSARELAKRLDSGPLTGNPVVVPTDVLAASLGDFNGYLLKGFHAGRQGVEGEGAPISRAVMSEMAGVSVRTLQRYDKRTGVRAIPNYEIGEEWGENSAQEAAWESGNAVFKFVDHKGVCGRPRQAYVARQLPNTYVSKDLDTAPRGRQRKINKYLRNACDHGAQANSEGLERVFHTSAKSISRSVKKCESNRSVYWRSGKSHSGAGLWHRFKRVQ